MSLVALSELLGVAVRDASGAVRGRVRELAVQPQEHPTRVAFLIVRDGSHDRMLPSAEVTAYGDDIRTATPAETWPPVPLFDGLLLLKRDLLDQQIIDVHGRKVVRVNDVELDAFRANGHPALTLMSVNVGARGAVRRLCKGVVPARSLRALVQRIPANVIPWEFVDLLETDPARRVKLKIAYKGLARLHPADIADIVEELPPAERESVFETLDEEVAAEALEEVEPGIQKAIVESLDSDRAANIVEEMDPDAAADLLGDLPEDRSGQILQEMGPAERLEVSQLLAFGEHTAAGRMTTEFVAVPAEATVDDAIGALKTFEGGYEAMATIYLVGPGRELLGTVPLVKIAVSAPAIRLSAIAEEPVTCAPDAKDAEVAELFDKYNLITLAVADAEGRLAGIITADDVIAMLRQDR
ncbi:MAG: magnesium transporter MgtE N-terminal domain-containing protein [Betaproteobacteria bacterium]